MQPSKTGTGAAKIKHTHRNSKVIKIKLQSLILTTDTKNVENSQVP